MTAAARSRSLFERAVLVPALAAAARKLDPRLIARNPVMFVVEVGAVLTTLIWIVQAFGGDPPGGGDDPAWFTFVVAVWLWLTVYFGTFAEAIAEGRSVPSTRRAIVSDRMARSAAAWARPRPSAIASANVPK